MIRPVAIATAILLAASAAIAQEHGMHAGASTLPPICLENAAPASGMEHMPMQQESRHPDLMAGMDRMNADMMAGATATDIDVAFVCSMIPHHQGAIDMAKAELAEGNDALPRELAEAIIAAQEKEIAQMLEWLASR
jgi:uncharacterized protein (DUF305 family)